MVENIIKIIGVEVRNIGVKNVCKFPHCRFVARHNKIKEILNEIRLENALANEIQQTSQIIRRTHIFDPTDNIYGEIGAEYQEVADGGNGEGIGGPVGGGPIGGGPIGGGLGDFGGGIDDLGDMGEPGSDEDTPINGAPDEMDLNDMNANPLQESETEASDVLLSESLLLNKKLDEAIKELDNKLNN